MLLEAEGVSKHFGGIQALDRACLAVGRGEIHALTGENGAGKSTLMRIVAGLESCDAGEIRFHGRGIAMIHQELMIFPDLSVAENICMGREPVRAVPGWLDRAAMRRQAGELLARLGVTIDPDRPLRDLSFAHQQSVEIARALAREADLIIMDEPTSSLSAHESELLFSLILDLKQRGVSVVYVSHRMPEILRLADTITVMRDGAHVATQPAAELDEDRLIALMVGRQLKSPPSADGAPGEVLLEVRALTVPGRFENIAFTVRRGEILGLAGLIGAGRSDVAAAIFGLAPAESGEILVSGRPIGIHGPGDALAAGIAMVTEDRRKYGYVPDLSVRENLTLSSLRNEPLVRRTAEERIADQQIQRFAIRTAGREQPVRNLSGGNQQKVVIARALLADPEILILDEPTRGIDVGAKSEIYLLIRELARAGKAILLISSEMNEILALSDRILILREGSLAGEVRPAGTSGEEILRLAMPN